ncbi:MAG: hypothetical protein R3314_01890 [Longimicrobiales bacterium]|nr:hypothetical protein [Longimicrobiales bacterium]
MSKFREDDRISPLARTLSWAVVALLRGLGRGPVTAAPDETE